MVQAVGRRTVGGMAALIGLTLSACNTAEHETSNRAATLSMLGAVQHCDTEEVRRLAEQRIGLNERNPDDQSTPMIFAAGSDQWPAVEILIDHGADIWAHDEFGLTAAQFAPDSRILRGSKEDQARLRVIDKLKTRGYPFPPPDADQVLALEQRGDWPPHRKERP